MGGKLFIGTPYLQNKLCVVVVGGGGVCVCVCVCVGGGNENFS